MPSDLALDPSGTAPRRLPPTALLVSLRPQSVLAGVIFVVSTGGAALPVLIGVTALGLVVAAVAWSRFRYGYDGHVLRVEQGVLQRQLRAVDVSRVQQVELDQLVAHRVLGLARLRVETASEGGDAEVVLDGLTHGDAVALRDALRQRSRGITDAQGTPAPTPPERTVIEVSSGDIALGAVTGSRLVLFPAVIGFLLSQLFEFTDVDTSDALDRVLSLGVVIAVLVPFLAVGVAVVSAIVQEGDFRIVRRGDDLVVSRGLVTRREAVVPAHRVQVVVVRQNWVRRLLGRATMELRSGGSGVGEESGRSLRIPLLREGQVPTVVAQVLTGVPADDELQPHPPAARRRAMFRWVRVMLGPAVGIAVSVAVIARSPWGLAALVVLPLAGVGLGLLEYRQLAHRLTDTVVAARDGALAVRRTYAARGRVQGTVKTQNPFQRRQGLASMTVHLVGAGGAVTITDAAARDTQTLATNLSETPGQRRPPP